jgi:hypothetical protein
MLNVANWILRNFSELPDFKYAQSVEFKGSDIAEEPKERGPQGFERGQSLSSVVCQFLNNSDANLASLQFIIHKSLNQHHIKLPV